MPDPVSQPYEQSVPAHELFGNVRAGGVSTVVSEASTAPALRLAEIILIAYFLYTAIVAALSPVSGTRRTAAWLLPLTVATLALLEHRFTRPWSRVMRNLIPLALIPVAYWQVDWIATSRLSTWQQSWIAWDRFILDRLHLKPMLESLGWVIPSGLETTYLCLYAIPPLCVAALYWGGCGCRADHFLATLFLGTLAAYVLLPYFPTVSPRIAFRNEDLPHYTGTFRALNVWLLDHYDIASSVFPSGHVAVAYSSAFGVLHAAPGKRWLWGTVFAAATVVFIATVYCRYHYAADGLASFGISALAWRITEALDRNA